MNINSKYDVIVVGGGYAGCEAALSAARMGAHTFMLNLYLDLPERYFGELLSNAHIRS